MSERQISLNFATKSRRRQTLPPFVYALPAIFSTQTVMIDKSLIFDTVSRVIANTDAFIVDVKVSPDNRIEVLIDSPSGVDIDTCVAITRAIEADFDRDTEDYELEVGSAGLTAPYTVKQQYEKNIGNNVTVITRDGRKLRGVLTEVGEGQWPDFKFVITVTEKMKIEGKKRPELVERPIELTPAMVKSAVTDIDFK